MPGKNRPALRGDLFGEFCCKNQKVLCESMHYTQRTREREREIVGDWLYTYTLSSQCMWGCARHGSLEHYDMSDVKIVLHLSKTTLLLQVMRAR